MTGDTAPLTARQHAILTAIRDFSRDRGYPPSMREIGDAVGLNSTSTVSRQLGILQRKGYVDWTPGKQRAVRVREQAGVSGGEPGLTEAVTVRFPVDLAQAARQLAALDGKTAGEWVRGLISAEIARRARADAPVAPLPAGAYEAAEGAFEWWAKSEECAGPEGTQRIPGRDELEAALLAAAPLIRAAERDRIIKLAAEHKAICVCLCGMTECGDERPVHARKFADLLREPGEPQ